MKIKPKSENSFVIVIFGVTGNLAQHKLIPALYNLAAAGLLTQKITIIGIGRKKFTSEEFQKYITGTLMNSDLHQSHHIDPEIVTSLFKQVTYISGDMNSEKVYLKLRQIFSQKNQCSNRMYYLATYPNLYPTIFAELNKFGLNDQLCGWVRVMIEKPLGHNLQTAQELNQLLSKYFVEDQIFRLDHYLGKETLQNILTFRFSNSIFEPLINYEFIDHIQVTAAEDYGIGLRGGYYDSVGALRDVGQNHILQMLALTTMDAPKEFTNPAVTQERIDLLSSLVPDPEKIVFGQYSGYKNETGITPDSTTDTFFAFKTSINSEKFYGVPIYVRAGKKLARTVAEVAIHFKNTGKRLFGHIPGGTSPNILIYRIQPNEGIVLKFVSKIPGPDVKLKNEYLQFCYHTVTAALPDPYLRLLLDALRGDQTFFIDAPEVEAQWKFIDPLFKIRHTPEKYMPGSWGPEGADKLIGADGRSWLEPSIAFCAL